jgi:hypothetical protein
MKNNIIKRLFLGFKKGYLTPTLPDEIIKFQLHPLIRILRFLGGIAFILIVSKSYLNYPIYVLYFSMFFVFLFTIYHIIITYYRIKHIIKLIKSDKLDIKNSPLDKLATLGARALLCFKGACESAQPIGLTLGLMLGTDEILKGVKRDPIFAPFLGGILNTVLPENIIEDSTKLINDNINSLEDNNKQIRNNDNLSEQFKKLNLKGDITENEYLEFKKKIISENKDELIKNNEKIKNDIIELLNKK